MLFSHRTGGVGDGNGSGGEVVKLLARSSVTSLFVTCWDCISPPPPLAQGRGIGNRGREVVDLFVYTKVFFLFSFFSFFAVTASPLPSQGRENRIYSFFTFFVLFLVNRIVCCAGRSGGVAALRWSPGSSPPLLGMVTAF